VIVGFLQYQIVLPFTFLAEQRKSLSSQIEHIADALSKRDPN